MNLLFLRLDDALCRRFPVYNCLRRQRVKIKNHGGGNCINIASSCKILGLKIVINGNNNRINIDENCLIGPNSLVFITGDNNFLSIGANSSFSGETRFVVEEGCKMVIKEECLCGIQVCFRTSDGHPLFNETGKRINPPEDVVIERHVWIGQCATILKGVHLAEDSMVGTMSLVNKPFREPKSLIAGIPAKLIRTGISWQLELYGG